SAAPLSTRVEATAENSTSAIGLVISSDSAGVTVTPADTRETVCNSGPSGPATGTISTSATLAPATLVTRPVRPDAPARPVGGWAPGGVAGGRTSAPVVYPSASDCGVCVSPGLSSAPGGSTAL